MAAGDGNHSISYQLYFDQDNNGKFFIMVASQLGTIQPTLIGDYDWVGLYETQADFNKDVARVAAGDDPDNEEHKKYVQDFSFGQYWSTDYDAQSGWVAAYWAWDYAFGRYNLINATAPF